LAVAAPASAQGAAAASTSGGSMFKAGVSFLHFEGGTGKGFAADFSKDVSSMDNGAIGVVGDVSFHSSDGDKVLSFGGAPRFTFSPSGMTAKIFAQFLIGVAHFSNSDFDVSENDMFFAPGFGVIIPAGDKLNIYGQFDIVTVKFEGGSETGQRFHFGVAFDLNR
jgi:hypothetical protein